MKKSITYQDGQTKRYKEYWKRVLSHETKWSKVKNMFRKLLPHTYHI